jgi:hypothetical protein
MFSSSLLTGLGISGVSTGVYAAFTSEYEENKYKDRKNEYLCIFCIILFVSVLILFVTSSKSESIVLKGGGMSPINNKPPF